MAGRSAVSIVVLVVLVVVCMTMVVCQTQRAARRRNGNRNRQATNTGNSTSTSRRRNNARGSSSRRGSGRVRGRGPIHPSCEEIHLPMCQGLVPYTHTKLPNRFNHTTQAQVYRVLEHLWAHIDHSCSKNTRLMVCSLYLPKCRGRGVGMEPCKRTCMTARRKCMRPLKQQLRVTWGDTFSCRRLTNRRCIRPVRESPCQYPYPTCVDNNVMPVCANLTFGWGTMPNMFQQCNVQEINQEVEYYTPLRASRCHDHLDFLLCGVYSPFCIRSERPFGFPCRELCEEIRTSCESTYRRLYHNLPWPNKLQCHRYPLSTNEDFQCVMPLEGANFQASG